MNDNVTEYYVVWLYILKNERQGKVTSKERKENEKVWLHVCDEDKGLAITTMKMVPWGLDGLQRQNASLAVHLVIFLYKLLWNLLCTVQKWNVLSLVTFGFSSFKSLEKQDVTLSPLISCKSNTNPS